jgi:RNA polymerase sigma-70 factor (ECF subfamily)
LSEEESDAAVVARVIAGDVEQYALLIDRHQQRIRALMRRMSGSDYEAEELTQQVFVRTYFALATYKPAFPFGAWIQRIAYNLAINHLRRERRAPMAAGIVGQESDEDEAPFEPVAPASAADTGLEAREELDQVLHEARTLPNGFRDIFVLRHLGELSYEEIAEVTGVPLGTVKSRLARARGMIVSALDKDA